MKCFLLGCLAVASLLSLSLGTAFASALPFSDVKETDVYYNDLKTLYERGIILESPSGKFFPDALMNRDEFVSIIVGITCKRCLTPTFDDILKYTSLPFVDFERTNINFYCVSYAKEQKIIEGYVVNGSGTSTCQDGSSYTQTPFCANNKITRIEAAAVLLRQAGLWNNDLNTSAFTRRLTITDVNDSWYGYAQKAIDAEIITLGADGKIRPDEFISKKEFVMMAGKIFTVNLCSIKSGNGSGSSGDTSGGSGTGSSGNSGNNWWSGNGNNGNSGNTGSGSNSGSGSGNGNTGTGNNSGSGSNGTWNNTGSGNNTGNNQGNNSSGENQFTGEMRILDKSNTTCAKDAPLTTFSNSKETTYTFSALTEAVGNLEYSWEFVRVQDGKKMSATGPCLSSFALDGAGTWLVRLTIRNKDTGATVKVTSTVEVRDDTAIPANQLRGLSVNATANILSGTIPQTVKFTGTANGGVGPYTYRWDFSDGTYSTEQNPTHLFDTPGVKVVTLTVRDSKGSTAIADITLVMNESLDTDGDGVLNTDDRCPLVVGPKDNAGCPKLTEYSGTGTTQPGFNLSVAWVGGQCYYDRARDTGAVFGVATCTSCPCSLRSEFIAEVRSCDVLVPTILSPDKSSIYSRGKVYELRF